MEHERCVLPAGTPGRRPGAALGWAPLVSLSHLLDADLALAPPRPRADPASAEVLRERTFSSVDGDSVVFGDGSTEFTDTIACDKDGLPLCCGRNRTKGVMIVQNTATGADVRLPVHPRLAAMKFCRVPANKVLGVDGTTPDPNAGRYFWACTHDPWPAPVDVPVAGRCAWWWATDWADHRALLVMAKEAEQGAACEAAASAGAPPGGFQALAGRPSARPAELRAGDDEPASIEDLADLIVRMKAVIAAGGEVQQGGGVEKGGAGGLITARAPLVWPPARVMFCRAH